MPITYEEKMKLKPKQPSTIAEYLKDYARSAKELVFRPSQEVQNQRMADDSAFANLGTTKNENDLRDLAEMYPDSTYAKFYRQRMSNQTLPQIAKK